MRHWLIRKRQPAPNTSHAEFACGGLTAAATDRWFLRLIH